MTLPKVEAPPEKSQRALPVAAALVLGWIRE